MPDVQVNVVGPLAGVCSDLSKQLRQRRQAVENRIQLAHWIGRIAVQQGQKELIKRIEAGRLARAPASDIDHDDSAASDPVLVKRFDTVASEGPESEASVGTPNAERIPGTDQLPIAGYESLAALHVVQRLAGLRPDELEAVRAFEQDHRGRRTILAKIDQLQGV